MKTVFAKIFLTLSITALGAFAADNSLGTWKLNMAKSKFVPPPGPVKSLTSTREAAAGGVKVSTTGEQSDGQAINSSYTAKYDGTESAVTGAPYDKIAIKQVNANTFTATLKKSDGKYRATGRTTISKDGKTLTTITRGTYNDGKQFTNTMVYDKQ
ncbi:MAG: hypothetical protein M3O35_02830 [Acidobacteriota bacterium]|nr:hypothetical protein [Acidobacteriota bacterium]